MKILVICQYYKPEPFRISDICEGLIKRGHEVAVVTGLPNYPMGEIYDGYRNGENRDEVLNGVKVHRCFTIGRKRGAVRRILNYYSYALSSARYVKKLKEDYDVVFVNQLSPVMMGNAAMRYKKKHGTPVVLYCLDLWPESLVAGGIGRDSAIYKFFHRTSEKLYKQADRILITSRLFADYFQREFGIADTGYLPQYAESIFRPEQCQKVENGYVDLMFAGNLGAAQSVDTIIKAAQMTADITNLRWHIVGDGSEIEKLQSLAQGMKQIIFHGRKPLEEMPKFYAMADAMLVTLAADPVLGLTLPGKVQSYMAVGKPVIGAIDGETRVIIDEAGCGYCGKAGDAKELAENAKRFISEETDRAAMGKNARQFYEDNFMEELFLDKLEQELKERRIDI